MNTHDWSTPLIRFKVSKGLMDFWNCSEAFRLKDLISIKPDKLRGITNCAERGDVYILCTPAQFAYIISEYLLHFPRNGINSMKPRLVIPPDAGKEFDIVNSTSCYIPPDE